VPLPISTATRRHSEGEGGCGSRLLRLAVMPLSSAAQLLVAAVVEKLLPLIMTSKAPTGTGFIRCR
jgi:hypothetical protein